jgi:hypothetical protein
MFAQWLRRKAVSKRLPPTPSQRGLDAESPFRISRPLAFMHIPKTSGTALMSALAASLNPSAVVMGFDHCLFGSFSSFSTFSVSEQRRIYRSSNDLPTGKELIMGHFAFSTLREAYPNAQIFTVLRDPISRVLSHWLFWRQHTDLLLAPLGEWAAFVRYSRQPLARFLNQPLIACQIDNLALRMLLWPNPLIKPDQFIDPVHDEHLVREAIARLDTFDFVDIIENDKFLQNLEHRFGRAFSYIRSNETNAIPREFRSPLHRELTSEAQELLEARTRLDLRLWTAIANRHMVEGVAALRERTILANIARYGVLMAN